MSEPNPREREHSVRRKDIQGLRAVAVTLVFLYHFFPGRVTGGFVGVDVFFVISGFLISGLLFREMGSGTIHLTRFYARRFRRLMPASLTMTVVTIAAAVLIVGPLRLITILQDAAWASISLANYHFAQATAGYFDITEPSPFLHFWSLAVEEQYYLIWPLLLAAVLLFGKYRKRLTLTVLVAAFGVSLTLSVVLTKSGSLDAYYSLATRAWELAIGGILAFICMNVQRTPRKIFTLTASALGALLILAASFLYSDSTPFPSWTALIPTLGTAMVIWAGTYGPNNPISRLLSLRPAVFVGNISYSLYLWHWPVLILGTALIGVISLSERLALAGLSVLLAVASYYFVELPTAKIKKHVQGLRVIAIGSAVALGVCFTSAGASATIPTTGSAAVSAPEAASAKLVGADRFTPELSVRGPGKTPSGVPNNVNPAIKDLPDDLAEVFTNGCYSTALVVCDGGDPHGNQTIVLAGDSHAGQWWPAVDKAARSNGWRLYMIGKNGCPLANVAITQGATAKAWPECSAWQKAAKQKILSIHPDLVIYDNHAMGYRSKVSMRSNFESKWATGIEDTLGDIRESSRILFLGQSPMLKAAPDACLLEHLKDVKYCSTPLSEAVLPVVRSLDEKLAKEEGAIYFDPTQFLCTVVCPMMTGNMIMYRDGTHITATYSRTLAPIFASVIASSLRTSVAKR